MSLIFVDCEAYGGSPVTGRLTEFGAVEFKSKQTFHGGIEVTQPDPNNPAIPLPSGMSQEDYDIAAIEVFNRFEEWVSLVCKNSRPIMVCDNPAFDFQWINCGFMKYKGFNPFGHSARRIGDFYAGLVGDFYTKQRWKSFRVTPHDHNPVHDALGNVEAFDRLLKGER